MHPSIAKLLDIQRVDREIRFLSEAKRLRPQELADEKRRVDTARASLDAIIEMTRRGRIEVEKCELQIRGKDADIEKSKIALNTAKTNQEYSVLQEQIARHAAERDAIEERALEFLGQIDQLDAKKSVAQKDLADRERVLERKAGEVSELVAGLEQQIAAQGVERAALVREVDRDHLELYDRILGRRQDFAISPVKDAVCQGCFTSVTKQDISQMMLAQELIQCRSCGRLLFLP